MRIVIIEMGTENLFVLIPSGGQSGDSYYIYFPTLELLKKKLVEVPWYTQFKNVSCELVKGEKKTNLAKLEDFLNLN